ncbi:MAG TPA: sugar ABC transporter substrate-binding protein [Solirubrobacterales bacterium]|jgi:ABC-type sugar transport system substrate-binding protein|nr:sugar ABC transporter substrate-binding protein [Solirubrobacterales bacterium]
MKRGICFAMAVVLLAAVLSACGGGSSSSSSSSGSSSSEGETGETGTKTTSDESGGSSSGSGEKVVLGESFCYLDNAGMVTYREAETATAEELGWEVLQPTNAETDQGKQISDIENLINEGATTLDIHQCTAAGVVTGIEKANAAGIPVFIPDQAAEGGEVAITVGVENVESAEMACEQFLKMEKERGNTELTGEVIMVQGEIGSEAELTRNKGFEDCMSKEAPNMKILIAPTKWDGESAASGVRTLLNSAQDLRGIFLQSDIAFSTAVEQVLESSGKIKPPEDPEHLIVFGIDGGCEMLNYIREGKSDFTVSSPLNQYGPIGLPFLQLALEEKLEEVKPGTKSTLPSSKGLPITKISTGLKVIAPPTMMTKQNVNDPEQWSNASGCEPTA